MFNTFEASGNLDNWPKNERGKPTQVAVFGLKISKSKVTSEILWTAKFPDLELAMYWAAKKEIEAMRKRGWDAASRVLWQHALTPEDAVEACRKNLEPQFIHSMRDISEGKEPTLGDGPLKEVNPFDAEGVYFEIAGPDGKDVIPPFFVPLDSQDDD